MGKRRALNRATSGDSARFSGAAQISVRHGVSMDGSPTRIRGVRSYATPYTKRIPFVDVLVVGPDQIQIRPIVGRTRSYSRAEIRRVAAVSYRVLPGVRRKSVKLTFNTERVLPMFFRTVRFRRLERALTEAGWKLSAGDPV